MILKKLLLVAVVYLSILSNQAFAQNVYKVTGKLTDSTSAPISDANVILTVDSDTLKCSSDKNGLFLFSVKKTGEFNLTISHIRFARFNGHFFLNPDSNGIDLGAIKLRVYTKLLDEISIKATRKPITFKKDTTEYDVDYFRNENDETLDYLLKKLPGINLSGDGDLTTEGKKVTKLRVNGQDFFSGDIKEFIKKLPAGIFSKLQIVNDFGVDAAFSGIKTKPGEKILNLVTKPGMDKAIFGNVYASIGTNKLIGANTNGNYWKGSRQISGDVNLQNATNAVGSSTNNRADLRYKDQIGKYIRIGTNYNFDNARKSEENSTFSTAISPLGTLKNQTDSKSFLKSTIPSFGLNINYNPNQTTSIRLSGDFNQNNSKDSTILNSQQTGLINQGLNSSSFENNKGSTGNVNIGIGQKLGKTGRVVTANFHYRTHSSDFINTTYRNIRYNDTHGNIVKDSIFNSLTTKTFRASDANFMLAYTEPLSSHSNLDLVYNFSGTLQHTVLSTAEILHPLQLAVIDSLSSRYKNSTANHNLEIDYRLENDKITVIGGLNLQRTVLTGVYANSFGRIRQSMFNLSPKLNLTYNRSQSMSLELNYSTGIEVPAIDELQPVQDIQDLQNISIGNPNLKPSFTHQVEFNFRHLNDNSNQLFNAGLTASFIQNKIVPNTVIIADTLNTLKQVTRFINANGSYRLGAHYDYSIPLKIANLTLNTNYGGSIDFNNDVIYTDNIKTENYSRVIVQNIKTLLASKHLNSELTINYTGISNQYNIGQGLKSYVSTWTFSLNENIVFDKSTSLMINAVKRLNYGYTNIQANNSFIVNATFSRSFFKQNLQVNLQASDIFNQASNINQVTVANSIINNRTNYISRFFILSLNYKISRFAHLK